MLHSYFLWYSFCFIYAFCDLVGCLLRFVCLWSCWACCCRRLFWTSSLSVSSISFLFLECALLLQKLHDCRQVLDSLLCHETDCVLGVYFFLLVEVSVHRVVLSILIFGESIVLWLGSWCCLQDLLDFVL